ncbi:unnamed protein product [marine sediment metagenome]|uniref:Uncharacterized protein n=1 Tax=marine sediment metagenome TaxID=412755 RepID=X1KZE1_9ZZZZ
MSHTSREPSTKFYGPNAPIWPIVTPVSVDVQLHNLQPGEFWIPGSEVAVHTLRHLPRVPASWVFALEVDGFRWWIVWHRDLARIACRNVALNKYAFRLFLYYGQTRWGTSDLVLPAGTFAFNGTITISWIGA